VQLLCNPCNIKDKQPVDVTEHKSPGLKQLGKIISPFLLHSLLIVFPPQRLSKFPIPLPAVRNQGLSSDESILVRAK
jgi:hypothetical protein